MEKRGCSFIPSSILRSRVGVAADGGLWMEPGGSGKPLNRLPSTRPVRKSNNGDGTQLSPLCAFALPMSPGWDRTGRSRGQSRDEDRRAGSDRPLIPVSTRLVDRPKARSLETIYHLHLVSDATGETINSVPRACLVQFEGVEPIEHSW